MTINLAGRDVFYEVTYKKMKSIRLRIMEDGTCKVSAPHGTPISKIEELFHSHQKGILNALNREKQQDNPYDLYKDTLTIFGKVYRVKEGDIGFRVKGDEIIFGKNLSRQEQIIPFLKAEGEAYFTTLLKELHPLFSGIPYPQIRTKPLRSMWGSCNRRKEEILMNTLLYPAPLELTRHVLLHELSHFKVPNHGKDFYRVLSTVDYRYKENREALKAYTILKWFIEEKGKQ